ncbi:MAG: hypothetical protein GY861_20275 [bacterium]|nr:hypothetical protein [bacterium]
MGKPKKKSEPTTKSLLDFYDDFDPDVYSKELNCDPMEIIPIGDDGFGLRVWELYLCLIFHNADPCFTQNPEKITKDREALHNFYSQRQYLNDGKPDIEICRKYISNAKRFFKHRIVHPNILFSDLLYEDLDKVKTRNCIAIIEGEKGTGKKSVAQALHAISGKHENSFKVVDCGKIPRSELESVLLGTKTSSQDNSEGYLHRIKDGTIFIENINKLPRDTRIRLFNYKLPDELRLIIGTAAKQGIPEFDIIKGYHKIVLQPLRKLRHEIPLLIFLLYKEFIHKVSNSAEIDQVKLNEAFNTKMQIPAGILLFWLVFKDWKGNYKEFTDTINNYLIGSAQNEIESKKQGGVSDWQIISKPGESGSPIIQFQKTSDGFRNRWNLLADPEYYKYVDSNVLPQIDTPIEIENLSVWPALNILTSLERSYSSIGLNIQIEKLYRYFSVCSFSLLANDETKPSIIESSEPLRKYSTENYKLVKAVIDGKGMALTDIELIPKTDNAPKIVLDFKRRASRAFTLLLFLIYERSMESQDWLSEILDHEDDVTNYPNFNQIVMWCSIQDFDLKKEGWWLDIANEYRKTYKNHVNRKAENLGFEGDLLVSNPQAAVSGGYKLNPLLKAKIDIKTS